MPKRHISNILGFQRTIQSVGVTGSYLETLAEAYDLTIYWERNKKCYNRTDRGRDGRSVNFYNNGGRGRGNNNNNYDKRGRGNNNRYRDNNNNNESNSEPSERLCHGEVCYGGCRNPNCTGPNADNRNIRNTNNAKIDSSNNDKIIIMT